ncbi:hypothetical protein KC19_3G013100 [Ceratodon purpureus]|uniref:Uncharacterized protein n=1 Tax=Ceratodon purpureus TaxID=3225 RepID=A0A8T0IG08_CERPU|nr:hypothetical protein KC19_3G013100 [Ceratodon purpureus]
MASESIPIAICINAIFSYLADGKRHIICDRLEKGFVFFQKDLKYYTVDELHDTVKVPLHAAKILERSGLLKDPPAPTYGRLVGMLMAVFGGLKSCHIFSLRTGVNMTWHKTMLV